VIPVFYHSANISSKSVLYGFIFPHEQNVPNCVD